MAVENGFALKLCPVLFYVVVLYHYHHQIYGVEKIVEAAVLAVGYYLVFKHGVVALQRCGEGIALHL